MGSTDPVRAAARPDRRRRRLRRIGLPVALVFLLLLAPAAYSYTTTMMQPSSLPLWPRSVEWLRAHHGNWLVDEVEHYYYSWKTPAKGGPQLTSLPTAGLTDAATEKAEARRHGGYMPPPISPVFAHPLPGEGVWRGTGPTVAGRSPVLVTTFRTEVDYPRIVAYVAWFDHTRTSAAWYPGRYEPPNAPIRGPMSVPPGQRWRLLATFNGGFIYNDGNNGSSINGKMYEPLKAGLATLVAYRNGHVDVKTWHGGPVAGPQVAFARQSLPLIIDHGRLNPALNDSSQWGFTLGNAVRVWRTGVGIDRHGNLPAPARAGHRAFQLSSWRSAPPPGAAPATESPRPVWIRWQDQRWPRRLIEVEGGGQVAEDGDVLADSRPRVGPPVGARVEPLAVQEV